MTKILSAEDVKELMRQAGSAGADPVGMLRRILQGLGDDASVTGDVLRQGIAQAGFSVPPDAANLLGSVTSIAKTGDQVKTQLASQVQIVAMGTPVRVGPEITFALQNFPDGIALADISGIAVNKFMWIDIQRVQFREAGGKRTVRVDTSFGGQEFNLP